MDMIHGMENYEKNIELYEQICGISNQVQRVIDSNDLADFLLLVIEKN